MPEILESKPECGCISLAAGNNFLMNKAIISVLGAVLIPISGCDWATGIRGNGQIKTDQRSVGDFVEIKASGGFHIEWRSGSPSLTITTDRNLLEYIESSVSDNQLRLRNRERISPTHGVKVLVSSPTRNGARLSGAVDLKVPQLAEPKFYFQSTGASEVQLDGKADELLADMTGASELRAKDLQTRTVEISTTGAAEAEVTVSDSLKVSITGAGTVNYHGNPPHIEKHVTGAGSIRHRD